MGEMHEEIVPDSAGMQAVGQAVSQFESARYQISSYRRFVERLLSDTMAVVGDYREKRALVTDLQRALDLLALAESEAQSAVSIAQSIRPIQRIPVYVDDKGNAHDVNELQAKGIPV